MRISCLSDGFSIQVTMLFAHHGDVVITHVAASDGATAIATNKGDVYILHEYQCRKIASK